MYEKAADQGDSYAQRNIGLLYKGGIGVRQDYKKAKEWYEKSAGLGNASAQFLLGRLYHKGKGVRQDYKRAKEYYGQACDNGFQLGCDEYANLNKKGY